MIIKNNILKSLYRNKRTDQCGSKNNVLPIVEVVQKGSSVENILSRFNGNELIRGRSDPIIYLVTPSFNSVATIGRTIDSVISQIGDFFLYYHIQDGGSTDGTLRLLEDYKRSIEELMPSRVQFTYSSCRDNGMYDALYRGFDCFAMSPNSWMGWINSDDQLGDGVLKLLATLSPTEEIEWITGQPSIRSLDGILKTHNIFYSNDLLASGLCDGKSWWFLQQEGTFWRAKWWADLSKVSHFNSNKFAGDYHLWRVLAEWTDLYQYDGATGYFNKREGQISSTQLDKYYMEINSYWCRYMSRPRLKKYSEHSLNRLKFNGDQIITDSVRFRVDGEFCVRVI